MCKCVLSSWVNIMCEFIIMSNLVKKVNTTWTLYKVNTHILHDLRRLHILYGQHIFLLLRFWLMTSPRIVSTASLPVVTQSRTQRRWRHNARHDVHDARDDVQDDAQDDVKTHETTSKTLEMTSKTWINSSSTSSSKSRSKLEVRRTVNTKRLFLPKKQNYLINN